MTNKPIRIGLIARSDYSGLAYQTKAIYDLLKPTKVLLIDSTPFNGREQHYTWYSNPQVSMGFPTDEDIDLFLRDVDVVISCEIFYHDKLVDMARERGIKTILQPNPELNPLIYNPTHSKPDAIFLPTSWYEEQLSKLCKTYICPPPITIAQTSTEVYKEKEQLNILHIAGRRAYMDRNGTELVSMLPKIEGVNIHIHDQGTNNVDDPADIYKGDYHAVLIPRRYGGLCLPMLESLAHDLPVLMPQLPPNHDLLDKDWLIPVAVHLQYNTKSPVKGGIAKPRHIVNKLLEFRDMDNETYQRHRSKAHQSFERYTEGLSKWHDYIHEVVAN